MSAEQGSEREFSETSASVPNRKLERLKTTTDIAQAGCQMVAIAAAGLWAIVTFNLTECPNRKPTLAVETELLWQAVPQSETCFADWNIVVTNQSTRSVAVKRVDVRVWSFATPAPPGDKPTFVELEALRPAATGKYLFQKTLILPTDPLIKNYPPKANAEHTFEWLFNQGKSPDWLVFEVVLFEDVTDDSRIRSALQWSAPCETAESTGDDGDATP
jgi:hypothetical protein